MFTTWMGTDTSHGRRCFKCWKTASSGNPQKRIPTRELRMLWILPWKKWYYYMSDSKCIWKFFSLLSIKDMYLFFSGLWPWWESFLSWFWEDSNRWKPFTRSFWQLPPRCKGRNQTQLLVHVKCIVILKGRALKCCFPFVWQRIWSFEQHAFQEPHKHWKEPLNFVWKKKKRFVKKCLWL